MVYSFLLRKDFLLIGRKLQQVEAFSVGTVGRALVLHWFSLDTVQCI